MSAFGQKRILACYNHHDCRTILISPSSLSEFKSIKAVSKATNIVRAIHAVFYSCLLNIFNFSFPRLLLVTARESHLSSFTCLFLVRKRFS